MRTRVPLLTLLLLAVPAAAAPPDLPGLLAEYLKEEGFGCFGNPARTDPDYLGCLLDRKTHPTVAAVTASLVQAWGVSPAGAQAVLLAHLSRPGPEAFSAYREALRVEPASSQVRALALRTFAKGWSTPPAWADLTQAVAGAPDPAAAALDLAAYQEGEGSLAALAAALQSRPAHALLALKGADLAARKEDPALAAALAEAAYRMGDPGLAGPAAALWIGQTIRCGAPLEALRAWDGLPEPVRRAALTSPAQAREGALTCTLKATASFRTDLAVALYLAGRPGPAQALLPAPPKGAGKEDDPEPVDAALPRDLIQAMAQSGPDPFDLMIRLAGSRLMGHAAWAQALTAWAGREGYLEALPAPHPARWEDATTPVPWPPAVTEAAARLRAAHPGPPARPAVPGGDPAGERIARLLAAPRLVIFQERPMPAGTAPLPPGEPEALMAALKQDLEAVHFPDLFLPVRLERQGQEVVVLGLSQGYDPVGEVSPGAYWLARSHDGGRHWDRPLYTGLQMFRPYVFKTRSSVSMLAGDQVRLEADIRDLDEASVTFPPVGLRVRRSQDGVLLEATWDDLARDRDGDGLTDLEEERLVTDPTRADSDGDGWSDRIDPQPQVKTGLDPAPPRTRALEAALKAIGIPVAGAILPGLPGPGEDATSGIRPPGEGGLQAVAGSRGAQFFEGRRAGFEGIIPGERLIVLEPGECQAWRAKFGTFYPLRFSTFFLDRAGRRGYCVWDAAWQGGSLRLTYVDGHWDVKMVGSWIS